MNKLAVIAAFLGGQKNRYMRYEPDRTLSEKVSIASGVENVDGLELCYPADFQEPRELAKLLRQAGYTDDWYAYDVASKEIDTAEFFTAVTRMTRKLETLVDRLDATKIGELTSQRNPAKCMSYLFDVVLL